MGAIVKANVLTRFNALLGSLFVIMLVVGSAKDALFGVVVVANSAIGVVQELRAKRTLDRLVVLSAPRAEVRRDGVTVDIPAEEIVRGDIVGLRAGRRFYDLRFASTPVLLGELGVTVASMAVLEASWRIIGRHLDRRPSRRLTDARVPR